MVVPFLIGAAIGAGVGSYGHDNWGWSKDAIWQGAGIGAAGGYMAGAGAASAVPTVEAAALEGAGVGGEMWGGLGLTSTQMQAAGTAIGATPLGAGATGALATGAATKGLMAKLTSPMIPGMAASSPLMMGAAGMTLLSGGSSQGSSFQDKIHLSKEGKQLQKDYLASAKNRMAKAQKGDVSDRVFQEVSNLKSAETNRARATEGAINTVAARVGNQPKSSRGLGVMGGSLVKAQLASAGERMEGLFAPSSLLNTARREELVNASKQIQNLSNLDNQTAAFNYSSSLAKWGANQSLRRQKGAAIGSAIAMIGSAQLGRSYRTQMMPIG